jgi:phospholipid-transporting ATPase
MRIIEPEEYKHWSAIYDRAATTLVNRSDELDKAAELIEKDMMLLGATAIEDKLQDGVPETIHTLQESNIKVWVLTGDRQETAVNIGYSCKLLTEDMHLFVCNQEDGASMQRFLAHKLSDLQAADHCDTAEVSQRKKKGIMLQHQSELYFFFCTCV